MNGDEDKKGLMSLEVEAVCDVTDGSGGKLVNVSAFTLHLLLLCLLILSSIRSISKPSMLTASVPG